MERVWSAAMASRSARWAGRMIDAQGSFQTIHSIGLFKADVSEFERSYFALQNAGYLQERSASCAA